ncbi:N-acetyl-D-Glu racemase DgcA [Breoghania sp. JC706]|uniref:N-acetyl-D-Glu racemase DgcA n=1 Tax=Breoghania sp. JC706 TaxID=3117732 RepID=UPI00300AC9E7
MTRRLTIQREAWPLAEAFTISRGSRTEAVVVVVEIEQDGHIGRGECVPYPRYGETVENVMSAIRGRETDLAAGLGREALRTTMPAGAARNAIDCALWDLEAKLSGVPVAEAAGLAPAGPVTTAYTISLGTPEAMFKSAQKAQSRPLLKIKLGGDGDIERIAAVREAAPESVLIVDANEAWREDGLAESVAACARAGVALIEQPLPSADDDALRGHDFSVPICADESMHVSADLETLRDRYDAINIKLDKTGGLTEAITTLTKAEELGFQVMTGCMVGTSLAMAPALLLTAHAAFVDLDAPLLLAKDREPGLIYEGSVIRGYDGALWGGTA